MRLLRRGPRGQGRARLLPSTLTSVNRQPDELRKIDEAWRYPSSPEGTAKVPPDLPACGTASQESGKRTNRAGRFLEYRGWYSVRSLARLMNVTRRSLRRRLQCGQIPYLRVGCRSWWIPPAAIDFAFYTYGERVRYNEWVTAGKTLKPAGGGKRRAS